MQTAHTTKQPPYPVGALITAIHHDKSKGNLAFSYH